MHRNRPGDHAVEIFAQSPLSTTTELLNLLPIAIYMADAHGRITYYHDAAAECWGHRPELGTAQWCGSWRLY